MDNSREYNGTQGGDHLARVAFPMGGIGAGMVCLEGTGALSHVSVRNQPDVFNEPLMFSALYVKTEDETARLLSGPVPGWKAVFPWGRQFGGAGNGLGRKDYGLPRCRDARFTTRFPFATVELSDPGLLVDVRVEGWSPFVPGNADSSSLPVAALEFSFHNPSDRDVTAVYSFHADNFMTTRDKGHSVERCGRGFALLQSASEDAPWEAGAFCAQVDSPAATVDCAWFRGGWFDPLTMLWKAVAEGKTLDSDPPTEGSPSSGGSVYVPFSLAPGEEKRIVLRLCWYVPETNIQVGAKAPADDGGSCACEEGKSPVPATYTPWYAARFSSPTELTAHWEENYSELRRDSERFANCFYDSDLPPEVLEAVAANLTILKSPTVLRQTDGRLWGWEGCHDTSGCCAGSCTHVWNYAQAVPHLFPDLERTLRDTEFSEDQDPNGHQSFRSSLPVRTNTHGFHAAADGQLGGIVKIFREWRVSGDGKWLRKLWPSVRKSLDYCIETWDPNHEGVLREPHHNTYDIEFWGPDGMCTSFYLAALHAAVRIGGVLGDDTTLYGQLLADGRRYMSEKLFNGEYFVQEIQWQGLRAPDPAVAAAQGIRMDYSPEALEILRREGPKYQYGSGCLSDGVLGAWLAEVSGLGPFLDPDMVASHLLAVYRHNFRDDLSDHANPQRPSFALGGESGLLLCSWPKGGKPSLPFVYSDEVWTGIEYQVASHLMLTGHVSEGLAIVRAVRDRYDGRLRNPFNEYECGHWYARAMASYALLQSLTGISYDAVNRVLTVAPRIPGDFRSFLAAVDGYGTVGVKDGEPFYEIASGDLMIERIDYTSFVGEA